MRQGRLTCCCMLLLRSWFQNTVRPCVTPAHTGAAAFPAGIYGWRESRRSHAALHSSRAPPPPRWATAHTRAQNVINTALIRCRRAISPAGRNRADSWLRACARAGGVSPRATNLRTGRMDAAQSRRSEAAPPPQRAACAARAAPTPAARPCARPRSRAQLACAPRGQTRRTARCPNRLRPSVGRWPARPPRCRADLVVYEHRLREGNGAITFPPSREGQQIRCIGRSTAKHSRNSQKCSRVLVAICRDVDSHLAAQAHGGECGRELAPRELAVAVRVRHTEGAAQPLFKLA